MTRRIEISKDTYVAYTEFLNDSELMLHLDPGHGGLINGVYQTEGKMWEHKDFTFHEGVFDRAMALRLSEDLMNLGISHTFSTDSNFDPSLPIRCTRINNYVRRFPNKRHLCISLHGNAAGTSSVKGIEVFTSPGQTKSDEYAAEIYNSLKGMNWKMRRGKSKEDPGKEARFYMLTQTKCPCVLIEYGFFTNPDEAKLMMEPNVQKALSKFTVEGIMNVESGEKV